MGITTKELTGFKHWADGHRSGRGLLCHFYTAEGKKQKQYHTKPDYAYFNIFSDSSNWLVKGTTGHGITSERGKVSQVPCLNCYKVDDRFYEALETLIEEGNSKYELGIILDKKALKKHFGPKNVVDILPWDHVDSRPSPDNCWRYDIPRKKTALWPFNYCDVVRIRIPPAGLYDLSISSIPWSAIMGMLLRKQGYNEKALAEFLMEKDEWDAIADHFQPFPLL